MTGDNVVMVYGGAFGERSRPIILRLQGDGTLRAWAVQVGTDATGVERPVVVEATRELGMSMHGEDPSNDIVGLRTDEQRILRNRPYESRRVVAGNPFLINAAAGTVTCYTCPANTIAELGIWIGSEGTTSGKVDLDVGGRRLIDDMLLPNNIPPLHIQGIRVSAAQTVQAACSQGQFNIWVDVDEFSTGDTATGV